MSRSWQARTRFALICNPVHARQDNWIKVHREKNVFSRPGVEVYDLGWTVNATKLPLSPKVVKSHARFQIDGQHAALLMSGNCDSLVGAPISLVLKCHVKSGGTERLAKKWELLIKTDPLTELALVDDVRQLPVECSICLRSFGSAASYTCQTCPGPTFSVCYACYSKLGEDIQHEATHVFAGDGGGGDLGLDDEASMGSLSGSGDEESGDEESGDEEPEE